MNAPAVDFRSALLACIPELRAYGRVLCRRADLADDLVQETLLQAWGRRDALREPTALKAWLFTIMRHAYFAYKRKSRHEVEDIDGAAAERRYTDPAQERTVELRATIDALQDLPIDEREALLLVCFQELTYEEVAELCSCPVGTVKSRVSRARGRLHQLMDSEPAPSAAGARSYSIIQERLDAVIRSRAVSATAARRAMR